MRVPPAQEDHILRPAAHAHSDDAHFAEECSMFAAHATSLEFSSVRKHAP